MALYRKYRPATFAEVVGQEHVTDPLRTALDTGRISHAYLFSGPRGCGKTSSARILARSLNCVEGPTSTPCGVCPSCVALGPGGSGNLDVIELDAASHGGVDDTRELRDRAFYAPAESRYRVFIVDEAHMVTTAGFNALLKIVEEPPAHLIFVFATTEPDKVLPTIRSRTHHYPFRLLPPATMRGLLGRICEQENVPVEDAVYPLVIRAGGGSPRDSLSVLDQLLAGAGPEGVTYARAVTLLGVTDVALIDQAIDALAESDGAALFGVVEKVMEAGHDPRRFAVDLLERLRDLILVRAVPEATDRGLVAGPADVLERLRDQAGRIGPGTLTRYAELLHEGLGEMRGATAPRLLLEVVCARMLLPAVSDAETATLQRLERLEKAMSGGVFTPSSGAGATAAPIPDPAPVAGPDQPQRRRGAEALAALRRERGGPASGGGAEESGAGAAAGVAAADADTSGPGFAVAGPSAAGTAVDVAGTASDVAGSGAAGAGAHVGGAGPHVAGAGATAAAEAGAVAPAEAATARSIASGGAAGWSAEGASSEGAGSGQRAAAPGSGDSAAASVDAGRGPVTGGAEGAGSAADSAGSAGGAARPAARPEAVSATAPARESIDGGAEPGRPQATANDTGSTAAGPDAARAERPGAEPTPGTRAEAGQHSRGEAEQHSRAAGQTAPADAAGASGKAESDADIQRVVESSWPEIRSKVREFGPTLQALLSGASVLRVDAGTVVFGHQSPPLAQRLSDPRNLDAVRSAIRAVLGRELDLRWEAGGAPQRQAPPPRQQNRGAERKPEKGAQRFSRPSQNRQAEAQRGGRGEDHEPKSEPEYSRPPGRGDRPSARGAGRAPYDDDIPPPDFPDLPDDPGPDEAYPPDPAAVPDQGGYGAGGAIPPATAEEEQEMLAAAAEPVAPGDRRDPDEVALELLRSELGATRLDG